MPVFCDELRDFALGVIKVTEHTNTGHACGHADRLAAFFNQLYAEAAFLHVASLPDDADIVWTGGDTILAADAILFIDQHDPVFPFV